MKALVTAGGRGTRIRPHAGVVNKHLLPMGGQSVIARVLTSLARAGVTEVAVATNPDDPELGSMSEIARQLQLNVTYLPITAAGGVPEILWEARHFLRGSPFLFYLGDNLFGDGVEAAVKAFEEAGRPTCMLSLQRGDPRGRFGGAEIERERVVRLVEKPSAGRYSYVCTGLYVYSPRALGALAHASGTMDLPPDMSSFNQLLLDAGERVEYRELGSWWQDIGTPADLLTANARILAAEEPRIEGAVDSDSTVRGPVFIGHAARVVRSRIVGPAVIGVNALVQDSEIGPNAIVGPNETVVGQTVRDELVFTASP